MPEFAKPITSFQIGEVSDRISGRTDLPGYHQSCDELTNWLVMPAGGAELCPGTIYVGNTEGNTQARLFPFLRKDGTAYVLVMTGDTMEYIKDQAFLTSGGRVQDSITAAYAAADYPEIFYVQNDDDYYLLHGDYQAEKGVYTSDTNWSVTQHAFTGTTFSGAGDYARAGTLYQRRLLLGFTDNAPTWMAGSIPESFDDFTLAGTAWGYTAGGHRGVWMAGWTHLLVGTLSGEYSWGSAEISDSVSPNIQQVSHHGSALRQPLFAKGRLLFIERGGIVVREMLFDDNQKTFNARNLCGLADHILGTTAMVDWAFQRSPRPTVWVVRGDGKLGSMTYDVENNVFAWSVVDVSGTVEAVCVIPNGVEDQVYLSVQRTIDGTVERHIEYFAPRALATKEDAHYVFGGVQVDNGAAKTVTGATQADPCVLTHSDTANFTAGDVVRVAAVAGMTELNTTGGGYYTVANPGGIAGAFTVELQTTETVPTDIDSTGFTAYTSGGTIQKVQKVVTGLDHLEAESVSVVADGGEHPQKTVASGQITMDRWANKLSVGKGVNADLQPLGIDTLETAGRRRSVDNLKLVVMNTSGLSIGPDADNLDDINFRDADTTLDEAPDLFTGTKEKSIGKYVSPKGKLLLRVRAEAPLPATVLAIVADTEVAG